MFATPSLLITITMFCVLKELVGSRSSSLTNTKVMQDLIIGVDDKLDSNDDEG